MDFQLKKRKPGRKGLNMGLCPGHYQKNQPWENCIYIAEDSFWFLEPGIKKHCSLYTRSYAHWGATAVCRNEWIMILAEWEQLGAELTAASLTTDLAILKIVMKEVRRLFEKDFRRNAVKLSKMIGELIVWMRGELTKYDHISILGI